MGRAVERSRRWYGRLLRLYPKPYRDRFAESMLQTFTDLRREGAGNLWIFAETFTAVLRERARFVMTGNAFRTVKYLALTVAALMVAGIATVMVLARGTGEDITGVVAPALLLTVLSVVAAVVAAVLQGASRRRGHKRGDERAR